MRLGDGDHEPGLEAECVRPGLWLIESYDVERVRQGDWRVTRDGKPKHQARTLGDCREFIRHDRFRSESESGGDTCG